MKRFCEPFACIMDERGMSGADFARELQGDFASEKVVNVNNPKDLENRQIELNALEDRGNEIRVIFAVDKGSVLNFVYLARPMRFQILKRRSARRTLWRTGCGLQTIP